MRLRMHVKEGVARGLCGTCEESQIMRDETGKEHAFCGQHHSGQFPIPGVITECNKYKKLNQMTEWEAKQIGWIIEIHPGRAAGFGMPKTEVVIQPPKRPGDDED